MSGCSCGLSSRFANSGALIGYGACMSCSPVNGGWNTRVKVSKAACDSLGGTWIPPSGFTEETAPPGSVGPCGGPLNLPCDQYFAFENAEIRVTKPWAPLPYYSPELALAGNYLAGLQLLYDAPLFVNPCFANNLGYLDGDEIYSIAGGNALISKDSYTAFSGSCVSFGESVGVDLCPGILLFPNNKTITNTNVTVVGGHGSPTDTNVGSNGLPFSFIPEGLGLGLGFTIGYLFGSSGGGGGGNGPSLPSGPVVGPSAQISAGVAYEINQALQSIGLALGLGVTIAIVALSWPELLAAGSVAYIVTVYDSDGTTTTLTVQVPANGA